MQVVLILSVFSLGAAVNPIEKTLTLLADLQQKVIKEGEDAQKLYEEFTESCEDVSKDTQYSITTAKKAIEGLEADIKASSASIESLSTEIADLASAISTDNKDLDAARAIRAKEAADFAKADADLAETIDMLGRAAGIIEKEMKGGALLQGGDNMAQVMSALQTILDASSVSQVTKDQVESLLQDEQPAGAPAAAAYESHSGSILSTLEDMQEKAEAQRSEAQKAEMNAKHNFEMLQQKLTDEIAVQEKEMAEAKTSKAAAEEAKGKAQSDLAGENKGLSADEAKLRDLQKSCMTRATDFEAAQQERSDELTALTTASKILSEKTGGATARTYSFMQTSAKTRTQNKNLNHAMDMVREIAKDGSKPISLLASRIKAAASLSQDPFAKVKDLIQEMIDTLVAEAQKEADHKAYCDREMSETEAKKADKEAELSKLGVKQDKAVAKIAQLKEQIATLEAELGSIAKEQSAATELRSKEKAAWAAAKTDLSNGLEGVQMALSVLRDYYAEDEAFLQSPHTGAATGIIGMLEVIESDFSKGLAEGSATESMAQEAYEKLTQDNEIDTATKSTEVKYKTKDLKETEAELEEVKGDSASVTTELDAVLEYYDTLKPQCIAKPEPYAERKERREKEIAGLKEALEILESEAGSSFLAIRRA